MTRSHRTVKMDPIIIVNINGSRIVAAILFQRIGQRIRKS